MTLTEELKAFLRSRGADLAGVGDMRGVENCAFRIGVSVAIALPVHVIRDLQEAPTVASGICRKPLRWNIIICTAH